MHDPFCIIHSNRDRSKIWLRTRYRWRCNANQISRKKKKRKKMLNYQIGEHEKCSRNVTSINIVIFIFGLHEILLFIRMILNVKSETVHLHKENAAFCRVKVCGAFHLFIFWISYFYSSSVLFRFFDTFDRWLAFNLFSFFCVNMQISKKKTENLWRRRSFAFGTFERFQFSRNKFKDKQKNGFNSSWNIKKFTDSGVTCDSKYL